MGDFDITGHLASSRYVRALDDLMGRTGGRTMDVEAAGEHGPPHSLAEVTAWTLTVTFGGGEQVTTSAATVGQAAYELAARLLHGGLCTGCDKIGVVLENRDTARPMPSKVRTLEGVERQISQETLDAEGFCGWQLRGDRWERWCGERAPDGSTRERLARELAKIGAHSEQIGHARRGRYDENLSEHAFPLMLLLKELEPYGARAAGLIERVKDGEFDTTPEENAAYRASPAGQREAAELFEQLLPGLFAADAADQRRRP